MGGGNSESNAKDDQQAGTDEVEGSAKPSTADALKGTPSIADASNGTEIGGGDVEASNAAVPDEDDEDEVDEDTVGFEGWARVFFQARNDRSAQQLLPTNSSTLARESHLFVVVDPGATELKLYPDSKDLRLIVDPPIELKYFYAVSVRFLSGVCLRRFVYFSALFVLF
mmetsp:Transcript_22638/g.46955  ORF Transcript_22638/g.46955 Transcript_22638/m.46955 type:complete len:169 (-) Transcript_22638:1237-1743(-)